MGCVRAGEACTPVCDKLLTLKRWPMSANRAAVNIPNTHTHTQSIVTRILFALAMTFMITATVRMLLCICFGRMRLLLRLRLLMSWEWRTHHTTAAAAAASACVHSRVPLESGRDLRPNRVCVCVWFVCVLTCAMCSAFQFGKGSKIKSPFSQQQQQQQFSVVRP